MKKIFIHIGLPKTATTFFQEIVFPNIPTVYYIGRPYTQGNYAFNLLQYADDVLYNPSFLKEELSLIENSASRKEFILISDELFYGYPLYNFINRSSIAKRLSETIPDAEIILFLRNQEDLILSLYNQYIKASKVYMKLDRSFISSPGSGYDLADWNSGSKVFDLKQRYINHLSLFNIEHFRFDRVVAFYEQLFSKVHIYLYESLTEDLNQISDSLSELFWNATRLRLFSM